MYKKFDNNIKYLIACSGGPDSMALLDMYFKNGCYVEVGHVNYHKRDTAKRDENIVRKYCKDNKIKFNKLDVYPESVTGNFQAYARKARYEWFSLLCKKHKLDVVLIAHQQDDLIETYLMQKDKKLGVDVYGLAKHNDIYGANVYRPLLNKTKQDLIDYCIKNNVAFGIDESNLENHYTRNKVRHNKVEKMSKNDRKHVIDEINTLNKQKEIEKRSVYKFIKNRNRFTYKEFFEFPYLKPLLKQIFNVSLSDKNMNEIIRQLKTNDTYKLCKNNIYLVKEYGYIEYFNKPLNYSFKINKGQLIKNDYFMVTRKSNDRFACAKVNDNEYPLTIRNVRTGDSISMRYGTKKLNRFFIDNKIGLRQRLTWPIVLNKQGTAILVPQIGCNKDHYDKKPNLYVIKL